ncbi:MAG: hypothetical protein JWM47_2008 [Acidimicrobiales bacterium]|nr:hypothetical protein [Acidimicrobiales bacterium]
MERIAVVLERERELLEVLLFKLVETRLVLESGEIRFLSRATREVERARTRAREVDLMRAATVAQHSFGATLRNLAATAPEPWPGIFRDHHDLLVALVAEIEVTAHRNASEARAGLESLHRAKVSAGRPGAPSAEDRDAELARLARGAAYETVLATASRLRMPDLLDFLR